MKTLLAILQHPLSVLLSSLIGATALAVLQDNVIDAIGWFIPCLAIIFADLMAGCHAAKFRKEEIRFSTACRRTVNKIVCYGSWIITCVALNYKYGTHLMAPTGMAIIFLIEGFSFFTNLLEPKGLQLSWRGVLRIVGKKHNLEGLEDVIEKTDKQ